VTPAERLTKARLGAGLSAAEVARRIAEATGGSARAAAVTLARWEGGGRAPSPESLSAWATALGIDGTLRGDAQQAIGKVVGRHLGAWCSAYGSDAVCEVLEAIASMTRAVAGMDAPSAKRRKA
jgi:transcriptional regulator with XRE-family HTH domain